MMMWMQEGSPDESTLASAGLELKHMWMSRDLFLIKDNVLYRTHPGNRYLLLVVPTHPREEVLILAHDIPTAGHQGISRTKDRLKHYWWYRRGSEIQLYVETRATCNTIQKATIPTTSFSPAAVLCD